MTEAVPPGLRGKAGVSVDQALPQIAGGSTPSAATQHRLYIVGLMCCAGCHPADGSCPGHIGGTGCRHAKNNYGLTFDEVPRPDLVNYR